LPGLLFGNFFFIQTISHSNSTDVMNIELVTATVYVTVCTPSESPAFFYEAQ